MSGIVIDPYRFATGAAPEPGEYTYYRLNITANNGDSRVGVAELELYETDGGANQGTNSGTASASNDDGGNVPANAFDGDSGTSWRTDGSAAPSAGTPHWVQKEFDTAFEAIAYAVRNWHSTFSPAERAPRDWELWGSNDGTNWDVLDARTKYANWSAAEKRDFDAQGARSPVLWRLRITANNGGDYVGISALELYDSIGGADLANESNFRPGAATASDDDANNLPGHAFDDDAGTSWRTSSGVTFPVWLQKEFDYPFGSAIVQYGVRNWHSTFSPAERAPKDWKLQKSTDGGTSWTDVHTVTGETGWSAGEMRKFTI